MKKSFLMIILLFSICYVFCQHTVTTNPATGEVNPFGNDVIQPTNNDVRQSIHNDVRQSTNALPKRYDYFPMFVAGMSTEQILVNTKDGKIVPMSHDDAYAKYKRQGGAYEDMTDARFNELYTKSLISYKKFLERRNNGFVAPSWMYEGPNALSGKIDLNTPATGEGWANPGKDQYGNRTATDAQIAEARKPKTNQDQNSIPVSSIICKCRFNSYWESHKDACNKEEMKYGSVLKELWEKKCSNNFSIKSDIFGKGKKDLIIMYDNSDMPYWQEVFVP